MAAAEAVAKRKPPDSGDRNRKTAKAKRHKYYNNEQQENWRHREMLRNLVAPDK
jgi:hypothetical protein